MDKKDYTNKMDSLVNEKQTYEPLKRDPTPALQRRLNGKLLDLKKTETIDIQLYYRLRCRVPQSAKFYGLPKLHKPNIQMRPIVSFSYENFRVGDATQMWLSLEPFEAKSWPAALWL